MSSLRTILQSLDAFCHGEILFASILSYHKEASSLLELWMYIYLECLKVSKLCLSAVMELNYVFDECFIVSFKSFSILLQVHNCTGLGSHLINIQVVLASDLVTLLCSFHNFSFLLVALFGSLLGSSELVLDTEI